MKFDDIKYSIVGGFTNDFWWDWRCSKDYYITGRANPISCAVGYILTKEEA